MASGNRLLAFLTALMSSGGGLLGCGGAGSSGSSGPTAGLEAATVTPSSESDARAQAPRQNSGPRQPIALDAPLDVAGPPADAETTASGVASRVLWHGDGGAHPRAQDIVVVHYSGWTTDGHMFDSSVERGRPSVFPLNRMIPGRAEGLRQMAVGEQRRLWIPESQAYGGVQGRPAGTLVYDVELIAIEASPPAVPVNVAAAPFDAERTPSGLAFQVLQPGSGTEHPGPRSTVTVHYSGWTTDGQMFDSSVARGREVSFPLNAVIPGWTEGLQLMVAGEQRRFWIPPDLAYANNPGAPQGTLVFDVTLIYFE